MVVIYKVIIGDSMSTLNKIINEIEGYVGFAIVTKDGVPRIIDLGTRFEEREESVLATMCATVLGAAKMITGILYGEDRECDSICLCLDDKVMYIKGCTTKDFLICLILAKTIDIKRGERYIKKIVSIIEKSNIII